MVKMTAVEGVSKLRAAGVDEKTLAKLQAAKTTIDWAALLALGTQLLAQLPAILAALGL
jgi:hypothetical protein